MDFVHKPVLLNECLEGLLIKPNGVYLDGTLGGAGHSLEIAKLLNEQGMLIGVDRDLEAIDASSKRLKDVSPKVRLVNDNYRNINLNNKIRKLVERPLVYYIFRCMAGGLLT